LALAEPLKDLFKIITTCIPLLWQMFLLVFVVYYLFAVLGQYYFGGLIYTTNPTLVGTNFASGAFWPLNFNDLPSGFVTLFALMIVNNWYEIAQGFMLATHSNFAAVYFVVFFLIVNLIVLNIVIACILDCFAFIYEEEAANQEIGQLGTADEDLEIGEGVVSRMGTSRILRKLADADEQSESDASSSSATSSNSGKSKNDMTEDLEKEYGTFANQRRNAHTVHTVHRTSNAIQHVQSNRSITHDENSES